MPVLDRKGRIRHEGFRFEALTDDFYRLNGVADFDGVDVLEAGDHLAEDGVEVIEVWGGT